MHPSDCQASSGSGQPFVPTIGHPEAIHKRPSIRSHLESAQQYDTLPKRTSGQRAENLLCGITSGLAVNRGCFETTRTIASFLVGPRAMLTEIPAVPNEPRRFALGCSNMALARRMSLAEFGHCLHQVLVKHRYTMTVSPCALASAIGRQ